MKMLHKTSILTKVLINLFNPNTYKQVIMISNNFIMKIIIIIILMIYLKLVLFLIILAKIIQSSINVLIIQIKK
jgi:hypothetical protein